MYCDVISFALTGASCKARERIQHVFCPTPTYRVRYNYSLVPRPFLGGKKKTARYNLFAHARDSQEKWITRGRVISVRACARFPGKVDTRGRVIYRNITRPRVSTFPGNLAHARTDYTGPFFSPPPKNGLGKCTTDDG